MDLYQNEKNSYYNNYDNISPFHQKMNENEENEETKDDFKDEISANKQTISKDSTAQIDANSPNNVNDNENLRKIATALSSAITQTDHLENLKINYLNRNEKNKIDLVFRKLNAIFLLLFVPFFLLLCNFKFTLLIYYNIYQKIIFFKVLF